MAQLEDVRVPLDPGVNRFHPVRMLERIGCGTIRLSVELLVASTDVDVRRVASLAPETPLVLPQRRRTPACPPMQLLPPAEVAPKPASPPWVETGEHAGADLEKLGMPRNRMKVRPPRSWPRAWTLKRWTRPASSWSRRYWSPSLLITIDLAPQHAVVDHSAQDLDRGGITSSRRAGHAASIPPAP